MIATVASFHSDPVALSQGNISMGSNRMSSGKFSARRDVLSYRQHFAIVWQKFVTDNFDSPAHVAHCFQVDATTADKWWRGLNAPSGWVVGRAIQDPELRVAVLELLSGEA